MSGRAIAGSVAGGLLVGALAAGGSVYVVVSSGRGGDAEAVDRAPDGRLGGPRGSGPDGRPVLRIGWTAWSDAEVMTTLASTLLEERLDYPARKVMADIGVQYEGVQNGDLDVMLMAWLPRTHAPYWEKAAGEVTDLGPLYTRARLGWAVPASVPGERLGSIEDLQDPEVQERIGGTVQGIDPGSGLMQASEEAMSAYGLDDALSLESASAAAMTGALGQAVGRDEWIVVTAWSPHWMFAKWDLRYLEDPEGVLGGRERIHALARPGFYQDFPVEVCELFARMFVPLGELEAILLDATRTSVSEAVDRYIEAHPERIDYWVTGELD